MIVPFPVPSIKEYHEELRTINVYWTILNNFMAYDGDEADELEHLCRKNIVHYYQLKFTHKLSKRSPAFVRLCMLYEKQRRYEDAIKICHDAINIGADDDGTSGKMYGRLARMVRKASEQLELAQ